MGMFYLFIRMVMWVHHLSRLIEIYLKMCILLYVNYIISKKWEKFVLVWQIGKGQILNSLISGWINQAIQILSLWWRRYTAVFEAELCSSKLYISGRKLHGNIEETHWTLSKARRRNVRTTRKEGPCGLRRARCLDDVEWTWSFIRCLRWRQRRSLDGS